MTLRLLLILSFWASCVPCIEREGPSHLKVQCRAFRYPLAVDCSWTQPPAPNSNRSTSFIATYRLGMGPQAKTRLCFQRTPETPSCTIWDFQMFSTVPYVLNVTAIHPGGVSSTLLSFFPEHIIKPDPPENICLRLTPRKQLQVQWKPPKSWPIPKIFTLKYRIRYKRQGSTYSQQVGPIKDTSFTLGGVYLRGRYRIQVAAEDLLDYGKPSDWSHPVTFPIIPNKGVRFSQNRKRGIGPCHQFQV